MDKKLLISLISVTVGILIVGIFILTMPDQKTGNSIVATADAKVEVTEFTHDWGEIGINDGNVNREFSIKNGGSEPLSLYNVVTSCMCTTAKLSLDDDKSPEFGMHTKSSFVLEIPPQETARLKVVFDPAFHGPSGVGPISRQVKVVTNDPGNPELDFSLTAVVKS